MRTLETPPAADERRSTASVQDRAWRFYRSAVTWMSLPVVLGRAWKIDARRPEPAGRWRLLWLALKFWRNRRRIKTASHHYEHLFMAGQLLAVDAGTEGIVVECGCYKGGSSANLSLACALVKRELHVYDSFAGLPEPDDGDEDHALVRREVVHRYEQGMYTGTYDEVERNIRNYGALDCCRLQPGYFEDSLRDYHAPCVLAFIDVDLRSSLEDCVRAIWPQLAPGSALFVHEAEHHEVSAFFFDSDWWQRELGTEPPGLIGAGSGVGLFPRAGMWGSSLGFTIKEPPRDDYQQVIAPG